MLTLLLSVGHAAPDDCAPWLARLQLTGAASLCQVSRFGPSSTVVLARVGAAVVLARFERSGDDFVVAGSTTNAFPDGRVNDDYVSGEPRLDLADYRVAPGRWAIGVRVGYESSCNGWNAACEVGKSLVLFDDRTLRPLLAVPIETSGFTAHCDPPDGPACRNDRTVRYVLEVTDHVVDGHYDLLVRAEPPVRDEQVYRWTGERYELQ